MMSNWLHSLLQSLSEQDYLLLCAVGLLFLMQTYFYIRYMAGVNRWYRRQKKHQTEHLSGEVSFPGVSVVVCARNEAQNLENYLQSLLTQDYPLYEVIVVNDGSEDRTQDVIERYLLSDSRLRTTFVPLNARVGSTKKLGLTLAAKSAIYDYLLLTDADCRPESPKWISEMMKGFNKPEAGVVLGYSGYFYEQGILNKIIRYDTLFNGLHYLGSAICGHPYMGVGRNLAYCKSLFFAQGGFKKYMNSRSGDDDLLVNHIARKKNTQVVLSRESITWSIPKHSFSEWFQQKRRHLSVSPKYRFATQVRLLFEPLTRGLFYGSLILAGVMSSSPMLWVLAAILCLTRWIVQAGVINKAAKNLGEHKFGMSIVVWDIVLPLISLYILITNTMRKPSRW